MLLELHVKNLALIEKADVEFGEGLNILTGETGAGKSIIIGSVTMALGGKASKDVIRRGADHAYIELIFFVDSKEKKKALMQLGTEPTEEGMVIISRKIMPSRSVSRINDETVTMARLRQITGLLLDIHGQHEHQSLLYKSKHLEILDAYVKAQTQPVKRKIEEEYKNYCKLKERLLSFKTDEDARLREMDFLRFEIQEIENGEVKEGEEEELTLKYRRFAHARRIAEELENARGLLQRDFAAQALRSVEQAAEYDKALEGIRDQLYDAEAILNDASREISSYMGSMEFDEEVFRMTESRLDQIHDLQRKYGNTTQLMLENLEKKKNRLEELENFDAYREKTEKDYIPRHRLEELATLFKDGLIADDKESAMEYFNEVCTMSGEEKSFFDILSMMVGIEFTIIATTTRITERYFTLINPEESTEDQIVKLLSDMCFCDAYRITEFHEVSEEYISERRKLCEKYSKLHGKESIEYDLCHGNHVTLNDLKNILKGE